MSASSAKSLRLAVEDKDAGCCFHFALDSQPPPQLTLTQVEQMIVEASQSVAAAVADGREVSSAATHHKIGTTAYECTITPLPTHESPTTVPDLLPGSFALRDTAGGTVTSDTALHVHLQHGARLCVVRHHANLRSPTQSGISASSAVFFIETDNDEDGSAPQTFETEDSVSFQEDMISITYHALLPSGNATSAAQSVQFETDDDEVDFDTISFATADTTNTRQVRRTGDSSLAPTPNKAAAAAATKRKSGNAPDPVANMTVRQRFEYYQARGNRKKVAEAPTAIAVRTEKRDVVMSATGEAQTRPMLSAAAASPATTSTRRKVKKSTVTERRSAGPAATAPTPTPAPAPAKVSAPAATVTVVADMTALAPAQVEATAATTTAARTNTAAAATDREAKLAELVLQLQEDVQRLLVQSHTDASRIAALRGALTETQRDYRALHDAHCTSLSQLNAYAAQMASGELPQPTNADEEKEDEEEVKAEAQQPEEEPQSEQQEEQKDTTEEAEVAETAEKEAEEDAEKEVKGGDEKDTSQVAPLVDTEEATVAAAPSADEEAEEEKEEGEVEEPAPVDIGAADETAAFAVEAAAADAAPAGEDTAAPAEPEREEEALPSTQQQETGEAATPTAADVAAAAAVAAPTVTAPLPALFQLSQAELRALLKQLGYIHHNRLLRRENALLMHQLHVLHTRATTGKKKKNAAAGSGSQRLRVVVRIRPVGLAIADAGAHAPANAPQAALASPGTQSPHNGSVRQASPFDRSVGDGGAVHAGGGNPLGSSSVLSPFLTPQSSSLMAAEHAAAVAAAHGTAVAPSDVFLQCDAADSSLQVRNPELLTTARDKGASVRGVRIIGPPLPQSLSALLSINGGGASPSLQQSVQEWDATGAIALTTQPQQEAGGEAGVSALRVAAAAQQRRLYDETVAPLVEGAMRGESGTVLSYGQVGSGKTYTMLGDTLTAAAAAEADEGMKDGAAAAAKKKSRATVWRDVPDDAGVIPRALVDLFDRLRDRAASEELLLRSLYASRHDAAFQAALSAKANTSAATAAAAAAVASTSSEANLAHLIALSRVPMCEVQCSVVELYNDKVRDLLAEKIEVPIYDEFGAASRGAKGTAGHRSSSAERRTQLQLRQAQAAQRSQQQQQQHGDGVENGEGSTRRTHLFAEDSEQRQQRRIIGHAYVSPECAMHVSEDGSARLSGATRVTVRNAEEAMRLLQRAQANRETHATASNAHSSRSHLLFTVTLKQQQWWSEDAEEEAAVVKPAAAAEEGEEKSTAPPATTTNEDAAAAPAGVAPAKPKASKQEKTAKKASKDKATSAKKAKSKAARNSTAEADSSAAKPAKKTKKRRTTGSVNDAAAAAVHVRGESDTTVATTAVEIEEQERKAQEKYLRRRTVRAVTSRLVFIDLAGTDRGTGQLSSGDSDRLREAQSISKGLSALGDVMAVLYGSSKSSGSAHVPFRSHKLTMLLRDALVKPTTCVVLACIALSESPMTALLSDAGASPSQEQTARLLTSPQSSASAPATLAAAEKQYWRAATERFMAAQRARSTTVRRVSDATTATGAAASASQVFSPNSTLTSATNRGGGFGDSVSSRLESSRRSAQMRSVRQSVGASSSSRAKRAKSPSKNAAAASNLCATSLVEMREASYMSEDMQGTGRTSEPPSPAVQQLDASRHTMESTLNRTAASRLQLQQSEAEVRVDPETAAQFDAIQASAEAEERAAAGALWITPRETLSTLIFLSRLWKA